MASAAGTPGTEPEQADNCAKKQLPLRLSKKLYDELAAWAADDFRSVNGQIEYLLTECVKKRKKSGAEDC
ncbi:MAG: hypothetical protein J6X19_04850 [Clostridia bacterium]|nr:hypothetical protein [Clostridia bacterium]